MTGDMNRQGLEPMETGGRYCDGAPGIETIVLTRFRPDRLTGGAALRNAQNIWALSRIGNVDIVSIGLEDSTGNLKHVRHATALCLPAINARKSTWERLRSRLWPLRLGVHPAIESYRLKQTCAALRSILAGRHYDLAVIEELSLAHYLDDLHRGGCKVIYDAHNVESLLRAELPPSRGSVLSRPLNAILRRRLVQEERRVVRGADLVWACSERDARCIDRLYRPRRSTLSIPNGVDVGSYQRSSASAIDSDWAGYPMTVVYPGAFSYFPNEDAAVRLITGVMPALRKRGFRPTVICAGRSPSAAMLDAARADPDIRVTGEVESMLPVLEQACVLALPIKLGSGTRLKILEAFAIGRPVVSTAKGAEGLEARDGTHILLRETPEAIADAVVDLWFAARKRAELCANALALVRSHYSWETAGQSIARSVATLFETDRQASPPARDPASCRFVNKS